VVLELNQRRWNYNRSKGERAAAEEAFMPAPALATILFAGLSLFGNGGTRRRYVVRPLRPPHELRLDRTHGGWWLRAELRASVATIIRRNRALATAIPSNWMASLMTICVPCTSTALSRGRNMRICRPISKVDSTERHDTERRQCDAKPSISISQDKARRSPTDHQILCILGFFIAGAVLANVTFFYFAALHTPG
jgi:hypothetical protein